MTVVVQGTSPEQTEAPEAADDDLAEESSTDRIARMMLKGGAQDSYVKVQRYLETGLLAYCAKYTPDEFERGGMLELIRKRHGAGRFYIELYGRSHKANGNGVFPFVRLAKEDAEIEALIEPSQGEGVAGVLADIKKLLAEQRAPAQRSSMDQLSEMATMAKLMREAFGIGPMQPPAPPPSLASQLGELITIMKGAREIAAEVEAPAAPPPDPLMTIASQALTVIGDATRQPRPLAPVALPPTLATPPAPIPAVNPTTAPPPSAEDEMKRQEVEAIRQGLVLLNGLAIFKRDPQKAADMVFDDLPEEARPLLEAPDWFEKMCEVEPSCADHREWYTQVRETVLQLFKEEDALPLDGE